MELDEAIKHCREKAIELRARVPYKIYGDEWQQEDEDCMECAKEHEQLAEWLEELKTLRGVIRQVKFNAYTITKLLDESEVQNG